MNNLLFLFKLLVSPRSTMSEIMDNGNWLFAAAAVIVVAFAFFATVNMRLNETYRLPEFSEFFQPNFDQAVDPETTQAQIRESQKAYSDALANRAKVPVVGDRFFTLFTFAPDKFYQPLLALSVFYVPATILLMCLLGAVGSFGLVLRRDYGTLAVCTLYAWAAAHLPFTVAGIVLFQLPTAPEVYLGLWLVSGLLFGVLMVFCLRTVFGTAYGVAVLVVALSWLSLSLSGLVFSWVSPILFSPFLLFWVIIYFGGFMGGEVRGFGNAFRQKQNLKRFLHNATVNPKDADAHVQLGLIYLQRRQDAKAQEHFEKAIAIDKDEIDANYELGKIAREKGDLQMALDHFGVVIAQDERHALSEIWREIGATYLAANMLTEAHDALEKFIERRSADVEGLYYYGKVLKARGEIDRAAEMFEEAIKSAKASPDFRRRRLSHWIRLARKESTK